MENNRYNNGKIYKLVDQVNGYFYIGSTCNPLSKRLSWHKTKARNDTERKVYKYFNSISWDNVKIILIEEHYLENREQLIREEDKVIQMYLHDEKCLNSIRAFVAPEEARENHKLYREHNKDVIQERRKLQYEQNKDVTLENNKLYYEQNKDAIREQQKQYYGQNKDVILMQQKQYYEQNKDVILVKQKQHYDQNKDAIKQYYVQNKDTIREQRMKKIMCMCGSNFRYSDKARHFQSKKHQAFIHDRQQTAETI